ncbi:MAG TPA: alternative ribosome rescue aminoacyl-tRNA hydrolase ArfB [Thermoanaerobaculia bacterium]|nr:alternative ribosome rescue aminoacyl-tRNA hydrolase ArfB [Thermoanaerobaculia bacterium]
MADPIPVAPGVTIPASALEARQVRASGPGGQNVNKVASRVELLVDAALIEGLDKAARARLLALAGRRRAADGRLRLVAQESRDRHRNLATARERVRDLVARALQVPVARRPTRPSRGAREARLRQKTREGRLKAARRPVGADE